MSEQKNKTVVFFAFPIVMIIWYFAFVAFDYVFEFIVMSNLGIQAHEIEQLRQDSEDKTLITEARNLGFKSLLFPSLYDSGKWKELALSYHVAPLGPQPITMLYGCNEGYGQVRYKSDRFGFRNDDSLWDAKNIDIALVGDSFVHGACVDEDKTIGGRLTSLGFKVLNLGTGGNSPIHYAAITKIFAAKIKPSYIIVVFYANDNVQDEFSSIYNKLFILNEAKYFKNDCDNGIGQCELSDNLQSIYKESDRLIVAELDKNGKTEPVAKLIDRITYHAKLSTIRGALFQLLSRTTKAFAHEELPYGSKVAIETAINLCETAHCVPLLVYIPNSEFWRPDPYSKNYAKLLKQHAENHGGVFLDMTSPLAPLGLQAYAIKGPHLSPDGYKIVASEIGQALRVRSRMLLNE
ncbi:SGNH/GDSL hydrolase family protein [Methylocystis sp. B8]|uniref:SGNH/GDSL hydrolase family protein n=1 Tax=Methylocystis sp. B8 TaxID=544938 RepID=UPI0010FD8463|nr:SGNH/GDSL hydrolase family protein [Methylocystis sp. B8]TLG77592.1 hypothetical protein FEV16_07075 [Methylocystis sp. B8]